MNIVNYPGIVCGIIYVIIGLYLIYILFTKPHCSKCKSKELITNEYGTYCSQCGTRAR